MQLAYNYEVPGKKSYCLATLVYSRKKTAMHENNFEKTHNLQVFLDRTKKIANPNYRGAELSLTRCGSSYIDVVHQYEVLLL